MRNPCHVGLKTLLRTGTILAIAATLWTRQAAPQEHTVDGSTLLLLHLNSTTTGAGGEASTVASGLSFETGVFGNGAYCPPGNQLKYASAGNINATVGSLEFWIKPRWNGSDNLSHFLLRQGGSGGILFGKDGGNFWRAIFNRFGPVGPELGVGLYVPEWSANQWHHCAFTWSSSALRVYIDGALVQSAVPASPPPVVTDPTLQIGADDVSDAVDAVLDELRISNVVRSASEVLDSYFRGLMVSSLTGDPDTVQTLPTWPVTIKLVADTNLGMVNIPASAAVWSIPDTSIVAERGAGNLLAKAPGGVTITATFKGVSAPIRIQVASPALPPLHETIPAFLATPAAGRIYEVPVLVVRYLATADGVNLDTSVSPDFYDLNPITLSLLRSQITTYDQRAKFVLEQGSRFRGYKNGFAPPSLGYRIIDDITVFEQTPPGKVLGTSSGYPIYAPDWFAIFDRLDMRHYVDDLGVREIWFWMGGFDAGYPSYNPAYHKPQDFRVSAESNMSSPFTGDISNSSRDNSDLPVYSHTYTVYGYNFRRSQAEAIHNHGHQIEAQLSYVNQLRDGNTNLWWRDFVGQDGAGHFITGRCGWTHMPPNTTADYDYLNPTLVLSDIEDWRPDNSGATIMANVDTWGNKTYTWPDGVAEFPQRVETQWYLYWMQNIPGYANGIAYNSDVLTNWWDFLGAWDASLTSNKGLHAVPPLVDASGAHEGPSIALDWVSPNPASGSITIRYSLTRRMPVSIGIFDVGGRRVRTLIQKVMGPGPGAVDWDARSDSGATMRPGVYFVRLESNALAVAKRLTLL